MVILLAYTELQASPSHALSSTLLLQQSFQLYCPPSFCFSFSFPSSSISKAIALCTVYINQSDQISLYVHLDTDALKGNFNSRLVSCKNVLGSVVTVAVPAAKEIKGNTKVKASGSKFALKYVTKTGNGQFHNSEIAIVYTALCSKFLIILKTFLFLHKSQYRSQYNCASKRDES